MKKIIIADIASIKLNNKIFGHYSSVAMMYRNLLHTETDVSVAGGPIYSADFANGNLIQLPYDFELSSLSTKKGRLKFKLRSIKNGINLFKKAKGTGVICQPYSFMSWMIAIILAAKGSDIYLIEYRNELDKKFNCFLFNLAKKKIKGVICPNEDVGKCFGLPYVVVPDYIYDKDRYPVSSQSPNYDFGMFGIMSNGKDIDDVIRTFSKKKHKVLIAGCFIDQDRYKKFIDAKSDNVTIINRYLSDDEYHEFIGNVKYVLLPYNENYKNASSGVIFDALFHHKPIITRRLANFLMVEEKNIGWLYDASLSELNSDKLLDKNIYDDIVRNIEKYLTTNRQAEDKLMEFLSRER